MRYWDEDVGYFVRTSPYLVLARPGSAARFLAGQVLAGEECAAALRAYPRLRVEPLSFFYVCLQSLGALDQPFFEALVAEHTFRGVVWGSFLALLRPSASFLGPLRAAGSRVPRNAWLVACAAATIEGRAPDLEHAEVAGLAARCRGLLEGIPRPVVPLRPYPSAAALAQMERERERVRACYRRGGVDAARAAIRGTLVGSYAQDYAQWVRTRRGSAAAQAGQDADD